MQDCTNIAVDWQNDNVYCVNTFFKLIQVAPIIPTNDSSPLVDFGTNRFNPALTSYKTLFESEEGFPRVIALYPGKG